MAAAKHGEETSYITGFEMRTKWIAASLLVALCLYPAQTWAEGNFETGASLLQMCEEQPDACTGYIAGTFDVAGFFGRAVSDALRLHFFPGGWSACPPAGTQRADLEKAVLSWLKGRPEESLKFSAASLIGHALHEAYPCQ